MDNDRDDCAAIHVYGANAPYGEAIKGIRKYDPLWGRQPGEKVKWVVKCRTTGTRHGEAEVEAASEQHAKKLAENLTYDEVECDWDEDDFEIVSVTAYQGGKCPRISDDKST